MLLLFLYCVVIGSSLDSLSCDDKFISGLLAIDRAGRKFTNDEKLYYLQELLMITNISVEKGILLLNRYAHSPNEWEQYIIKLEKKILDAKTVDRSKLDTISNIDSVSKIIKKR